MSKDDESAGCNIQIPKKWVKPLRTLSWSSVLLLISFVLAHNITNSGVMPMDAWYGIMSFVTGAAGIVGFVITVIITF